MITTLDNPAAASVQWRDLLDELNRWGTEGRMATLWWRDDDAVTPCRQLDRLARVAGEVPVALAVIPAAAEPALAGWLEQGAPPAMRVLQHGWRHTDHEPGGKKSEFPDTRPRDQVARDLSAGRERLAAMFGSRALAVLVPPWNRVDRMFLPLLAEAGIHAISRIKPRNAAFPRPDVLEANVHVDLVGWRGDRGFVGETLALGGLVTHLRARRQGDADPDEPTGILTHHLVQDRATEAFLGELIAVTRGHRAVQWLDAEAVFAPGAAIRPAGGQA